MSTIALLALVGSQAYPTFAVPRLAGETVPGLPPVTGRIAVDQFGYLPDGAKVAILTDPQKGYNAADDYVPGDEIQLRRRDGRVVLRGKAVAWNGGATHEDSGDKGWWFDFGSVKAPGEYYVFDPKANLRSPVFKIGNDVYQGVLRAAVRTFYYQRLSESLRAPYAEAPWVMPSYMDQDKRARALWAKEDPSTERDLSGGWMDVGDTNKYPAFNTDALPSLIYAYRANPKAFTDDFGIPESGNGLPDLLDEVKVQLEWLSKMQDSDGGVFVKMGEIDYSGRPDRPRYYGPKCTGASLSAAMNYALAARVYGEFAPWKAFADKMRVQAEKAWVYAHTHPRTPRADTGEIKSGNSSRDLESQERIEAAAAIQLYALTRKTEYHEAAKRLVPKLRQMTEPAWSPYEAGMAEALADYASLAGVDAELRRTILAQMERSAGSPTFAPPVETDLYRAWMNRDAYHWGSNTVRASFGFSALIVGSRQPAGVRSRLRQRALDLLHSFHGVNPLSLVMLTNMGRHGAELSAMKIWHERYGWNTPFASNPPPGYVVGGPNQQYGGEKGDRAGEVAWIKTQPRAKAYADFNEPWPMNCWEITENANYYNAAYIRLLAGLL